MRFGLSKIYDIWKLSQPADERVKGEYIESQTMYPHPSVCELPYSSTGVSLFAGVMESF